MKLLSIDIGGTKIALALFTEDGYLLIKKYVTLDKKKGRDVGILINEQINNLMLSPERKGDSIKSIGVSVPGISYSATGTVWAPNIPGWDNYHLLEEIKTVSGNIPVKIDSDRSCHMLGELWMGNAKGCKNVVFFAIGTGIGAGILINGKILRGSNDIAGSVGWMALRKPFNDNYIDCGCFEYHASGEGIAKVTREYLKKQKDYRGELNKKEIRDISSYDVMAAFKNGDILAKKVMQDTIQFWGMAAANLVSIFNPEKIIFGGGLFGPAKSLLPDIEKEASKWAQPISMKHVKFDSSALESDAGLYGAAYLALNNLS